MSAMLVLQLVKFSFRREFIEHLNYLKLIYISNMLKFSVISVDFICRF